MAPASELSARAVRRFRAVWAVSWAIKVGVLIAFVLLVVQLTGGGF